ncbi:MAG TPA: DUF4962 domain-containing protein, partial [Candidatus Methanomethylicus sp.]|nr:DUF4962 domain-containing protein [Candidatus Methanomethylicus sp.]
MDGIRIIEGIEYRGSAPQTSSSRRRLLDIEEIRNTFPHSVLTRPQMEMLRATANTGPASGSHGLVLGKANSASLAPCTYSFAQVGASLGLKNALEYLTWGYMLTASSAYEAAAISASLLVATQWVSSFSEGELTNIRITARILARTYDAFAPAMSEATRAAVLGSIGSWGEALHGYVKNYLSTSGEFSGPFTFTHIIYLGLTALAVYNQLPAAKEWMRTVEGFYTNAFGYEHNWPYWKGQNDGACSQGMYYNIGAMTDQFDMFDAMENMGFTNIWQTSFMKGYPYYMLYSLPPTMLKYGGIGEGGLNLHVANNAMEQSYAMLRMSRKYNDSALRWWCAKKLIQGTSYSIFNNSRFGYPWYNVRHSAIENAVTGFTTYSEPISLPNYRVFEDTGFAFLSNDITNLSASTMLILTSRPYPMGACGHAVQDNNGFVFYHMNEPLIIRSGQYVDAESVHQDSVHHVYWGMQAKSSNMVTLIRDTKLSADMGVNQTSSVAVADGSIFNGYANTYPTIWHPESYSAP